MTSSPASNNPRTPQPTSTTPKPLRFAFPFRDAKGKTIIDEHLFHAWLMNEPGGNFAASPSGLWHGGIHVSAEGAGPMLDLKYGVRCLADGEVTAYRLDRISPTSRIPASGGQPELNVPYSTSFALVRHTLEYPAGNRLSCFSLYMHLQGFADYECEPSQPRPGYWSTQVEVTAHAQDRPHPASQGQPSAPDRAGLRVRASRQHGTIRCTLPHGARATIGRRDGDWGQVSAVEGPSPYPPQDGRFVGPYEAVGGWIFMGSEPGDPVVREVMPDSAFDRVVIPPHPVKVGAGDLIGYLGPYWHTADPAQPNRIVHIEVFCDGTLPAYIEASRAAAEADYHNERPILRIDRSVKLYAGPSVRQEGANAPRTAIVQVYSQCVLDALPADCKGSVDDDPFNHGKGEPWWKITSADSRYADITGWVRNRQTPAGRVTRESPGHWSDFEMFTDSDANNPTLFGSADAWLDYVLDAGKPDLSDVGKLKPLATGVYRAMSPARNEKEAADELLSHGANRWLRFRASRLIPRHRSEWASEESYRELFAQLVTRSEPSPYHAAEIERISKLAWWDEVQGKVSQPFPSSPDVFHIHPIGLVGNFTHSGTCDCKARFEKISKIVLHNEGGFVNDPDDSGGATNKEIAWPAWQAYAKEDIGVESTLANLKALTDDQAKVIYLKRCWEPRGFCGFVNEKTALNIYDWTITSGQAIKKIQELLISDYSTPVATNNKMSKELVDQINSIGDQEGLAQKIGAARKRYYTSLAYDKDGHPSKNYRFLDGWLKRVDQCLRYNG
ncbi:glycosyl hydrolase 108 family protein [Paraburkholderia sp. BL10I2N1]|uniref:glycosyl hydrolase 108 family protein n=1 Tax=Paraburkholderia sp. BL10I2N1 TaxID=1938796 RepID=UPI00105B329C|nr:glycosyl hydrolase 108 family protein [Paraburkholderia sp. BL10I2N1]TDN69138.1 glycosyl hydrolase family 108 [Paraburkholderia sp. BL10I2N1]